MFYAGFINAVGKMMLNLLWNKYKQKYQLVIYFFN